MPAKAGTLDIPGPGKKPGVCPAGIAGVERLKAAAVAGLNLLKASILALASANISALDFLLSSAINLSLAISSKGRHQN